MANKKKPSEDDRIHGRSREVKHVVNQMSDVDFFDYRLVVRSSGIQELLAGHTGLRQGLVYVESLVEELRAGNYGVAHSQLLRSLEIFEASYNQIRRALVDLGEYYDDHPVEVREINHGLTDMCDGCDNLVKSLVALRQTKTGEALETSRRGLTHLREAAHRIGSHLRDIKDCCPSNVEFEVLDIRANEERIARAMEGARPVEIASCHSTHGPGEPCDQKPTEIPVKIDRHRVSAQNPLAMGNYDEETAQLAQQLEDKHVPLNQIAAAVDADPNPSDLTDVPQIARDLNEEEAMEELMRKVSENRARTIDKLVADARAAKAEAIANTEYVPVPGEEVPGMRSMEVKKGPVQVAANVVDADSKLSKGKTDSVAGAAKKADKSDKAEKSTKPARANKKVLEKALEKAKEKKEKRPPRKVGSKSETGLPAVTQPEKKKKKEELLDELTFDDADLDFNKAAKQP